MSPSPVLISRTPETLSQTIHLPEELITLIIKFALEDSSPKLLTDPPIREYDEDVRFEMRETPGKYPCHEHDCGGFYTNNEKFRMTCYIMHKQFDDLTYHHAALYYVSRVKRLAFNTSWLQICCNLFRKKTKEIQHLQCNFRNFHLLPESQTRDGYWYCQPSPEHKAQKYEALQSCNAVRVAFRPEWQILEACEYRIFGAEWMVKQRAGVWQTKSLQVEIVRLEAGNERGLAEDERLAAENERLMAETERLMAAMRF